jgi:hypothetical protein
MARQPHTGYGRNMTAKLTFRTVPALFALVILLFLTQAPQALASSGSITNVHATGSGSEAAATYTTNFDTCDESYCGWFPYAVQYPASQSCAPADTHLTYVGELHSDSGTEVATDTFYPEYEGQIRLCLYAYQVGNDYFIADAVYTPPPPSSPPPSPAGGISGSITNVHPVGSSIAATYTTNFSICTPEGYCGWFAHATEVPVSQSCTPSNTDIVYVGEIHSSSGSETASDSFLPDYGVGRLCLYAYHAGNDYFIAEAVYFHGPARSQSMRVTLSDQEINFYFPRSCVTAGQAIQLRMTAKTKPSLIGRVPRTKVVRINFSLDRASRTDRSKPWQALFSTRGLRPHSIHRVGAKITFKQVGGQRRIVRTVRRSFRIC